MNIFIIKGQALYSTANDPQPQMIPRPQMIPNETFVRNLGARYETRHDLT